MYIRVYTIVLLYYTFILKLFVYLAASTSISTSNRSHDEIKPKWKFPFDIIFGSIIICLSQSQHNAIGHWQQRCRICFHFKYANNRKYERKSIQIVLISHSDKHFREIFSCKCVSKRCLRCWHATKSGNKKIYISFTLFILVYIVNEILRVQLSDWYEWKVWRIFLQGPISAALNISASETQKEADFQRNLNIDGMVRGFCGKWQQHQSIAF